MTLPMSIEHARELARLVEHETHPELVLVGAVALGHHLPLQCTTADVDLALVMSPADIAPLLTTLGWRRDEHMRQRWYGPAHFRADIIPAAVLTEALGDDDDRRWDSSHPVARNELDFDEQSPFFAGLEVATIAKDVHLVAIRAFVEQLLDESEAAAAVMARAAGVPGDDAEQRMQRLVAAFDRRLRAERGTR